MNDIIMNEGQDLHNFGKCCGCGNESKTVNNFLMLPYDAPVPGTGWGCFVCDLPSNGAMAVLCDYCIAKDPLNLKWVIFDYPYKKKRLSYYALRKEPGFEHDLEKHRQMDGWTANMEV